MKVKMLFFLLLVGCFGVDAFTADSDATGPKLAIDSALYGTDENRVEVAEVLRPLIAHDCLLLRAKWGLGDRDPAPGVVKDVQIVFSFNGAHQIATFRQDQDIILLPGSPAFAVLTASYGAGKNRVDVTDVVRAAVTKGVLHKKPNWGFGLVDPAAGTVKTVEMKLER
jgi:hypothetical protein